jgi:hypothetical protein
VENRIWAIAAGVIFIVVVSTLADALLHASACTRRGNQPIDDKLSLLATSYRFAISVAGAWLTARLAPSQPMKHVLILGVVGTIMGAIGVVATWNMGMGPRWYPIALAVLAIPQCWAAEKSTCCSTDERRRRREGGPHAPAEIPG